METNKIDEIIKESAYLEAKRKSFKEMEASIKERSIKVGSDGDIDVFHDNGKSRTSVLLKKIDGTILIEERTELAEELNTMFQFLTAKYLKKAEKRLRKMEAELEAKLK